ncbi:Other 1 protein kinase, partial [Rhizoctonia solani]
MSVVNTQLEDPARATEIGAEVYMPVGPVAQAGPGQRRYTALGVHVLDGSTVFIKDVWRDKRRLFFEAALYEEAHKEQVLSGLMTVEAHGYVLDETRKPIRTPRIAAKDSDESGAESGRCKMRIVTKDVGRPLESIRSLRHFLCVMYDACAVQRNLYRRSRILHRDISDSNIMVAPDTNKYRNRNMRGYAEVRFVNQVLAKDKNANPDPACLLVDLGNGADLKVERNEQVLKERT